MMEKIKDLLRGNFWIIDVSKINLSDIEIDFLSDFFNVKYEVIFDEKSNFEEKKFLILVKKPKFLTLH